MFHLIAYPTSVLLFTCGMDRLCSELPLSALGVDQRERPIRDIHRYVWYCSAASPDRLFIKHASFASRQWR